MPDPQSRFISYVLGFISDRYLRELGVELLSDVPASFWVAPASSSGKYHPAFALGEGGLLRHTLAVIIIARDLCMAWGLSDQLDRDIVTLAAAFHDTYKYGSGADWEHTLKEHAYIASTEVFAKRSFSRPVEQQDALVQVGWAVHQHMSQWGIHPIPIRNMDAQFRPHSQVVAAADYIASRQYLEPTGFLFDVLEDFGYMKEAPDGS